MPNWTDMEQKIVKKKESEFQNEDVKKELETT